MNMEFLLSLYDEPQNSVSNINVKQQTITHNNDIAQILPVSYFSSSNLALNTVSSDKARHFTSHLSLCESISQQSHDDQALIDDKTSSEIARMIEETCERLECISSVHHFEALSLFLAMTREEARLIQKQHSA